MRWFLTLAVAAAALTLVDAAPAKGQIVIGGNPTYYPRYSGPFVQYPRVVVPANSPLTQFPRVFAPAGPVTAPYVNGGPVEAALRPMGLNGYGSHVDYYYSAPRYAGYYPANYGPITVLRPYNPPAANWKWVDPPTSNPGLRNGWFKNPGKGNGIGVGKGGKGR